MKVLILGSGGREHAIADAFGRSPQCPEIYVSPGNAGIKREFNCIDLPGEEQILKFCSEADIDLVFIGPEQPIAAGLSDYLREGGIKVFAPSQAAARLESSKAFAKSLMQKYQVPTARYALIRNLETAEQSIGDFSLPLVIKADGLAAGKGVLIARDRAEALYACQDFLEQNCGSSGVLIEEYLSGWEVSLFAFTDGIDYQTTLFAQDHKQLYDEDLGPNTGGMGAYAPVLEAEPYRKRIEQEILEPVLQAMQQECCPYTGVLYLGLMITEEGPKVIEFNCRLGDPEAQALLPLLKTDFVELCSAVSSAEVAKLSLEWEDSVCIAVVLAAPGYPGKYIQGIALDIAALHSKAYYGGVCAQGQALVSNGGRILSLVQKSSSLALAREIVYHDIAQMAHKGLVFRKDIGLRENTLK